MKYTINYERRFEENIVHNELKILLNEILKGLEIAHIKNKILEHINLEYYIVGEDDKGLPTDIVFSGGGPKSGLCLTEQTGILWATNAGIEVNLSLPHEIFEAVVIACRGEFDYEK